MDSKHFHLIGTSFRVACAEARKHLVLSDELACQFHQRVKQAIPDAEFAMLATCNRIEFYLFAGQAENVVSDLIQIIQEFCPGFRELLERDAIFVKSQREAMEHLCQVVSGLDSQVLGDTQIVQQVRNSIRRARQLGTTGAYLEYAFSRALALGSRVRSETSISAGSAGIASAAAEIVSQWIANQRWSRMPRVLVVGLGEIGSSLARQLVVRQLGSVTVANRTDSKSLDFASEYEASQCDWDRLSDAVAVHDVVISCASVQRPIIKSDMVDLKNSKHLPAKQLFIDAGMPPNVESAMRTIREVVGIDSIQERHLSHLERRRSAVPMVRSNIEETIQEWSQWMANRPLEAFLKSLYLKIDELTDVVAKEIAQSKGVEKHGVKRRIHLTMKQLLHPHVTSLRKRAVRRELQAGQNALGGGCK